VKNIAHVEYVLKGAVVAGKIATLVMTLLPKIPSTRELHPKARLSS